VRNIRSKAGVFSLAVVSIILSCGSSALSTTFVIPSDDTLIIEARAIVRGKVLSVTSQLDAEQDRVFTYVTLRVNEILKGHILERKITIKEPGGEVGNRGSLVFGTPRFARGEKVLLYLDTWADGSLRVHQMFLGRFSIAHEASTGKLVVTRNTPDIGVDQTGQIASGPVTNMMEVSQYTEMVRARLALNADRAREFEASNYGVAPILERPPEYAAEAGRGNIEPQFHLWNPPTRWFEADSGQPVVFKTNTDLAPNSQVLSDVAAAINAWSTVPGCSLRVADGGTTTGCGLFVVDGENTISFNNCDGYFPPGGACGSGIVAITSIARYDRTRTVIVNGVSFNKALESNLSFNPAAACFFVDHCKLQEVATHEMGHALGLHHSWDPSFGGSPSASDAFATMYYVAHFDGRCASLETDDVNGIIFIYPGAGGGPPPLTVATSSLPSGPLGASYSQTLAATGGTAPYSWSLVPGSGSLPSGLSLSSSGLISGTPSIAGTFNFTVQLNDSGSHTAQKALSITITPPALEIITLAIPSARKWTAFNYQLAAIGGTPPYTWLVSSGSLAPGLSLATTTGVISGTPSLSGNFGFTVDVTDSESRTASKALSIQVTPGQLSIGTATSFDAIQGTAFNYQPTVFGGIAAYTWSISSGVLPTGLALNSASGLISGTPSVADTFSFVLTVSDWSGLSTGASIQIRVIDPKKVPTITNVKYKPGKKLVVTGSRVRAGAALVVDGIATQATPNEGQFKLKKATLTLGLHEIRIVNPGNISSQPFPLNVE
jgi:hypothetical protein